MDAKTKVDLLNENDIGTNVTYWPSLHREGKRTKIRSKAFISESGTPVVFVDGVNGYVSTDHVEIGSLMDVNSPCFSKTFRHLW